MGAASRKYGDDVPMFALRACSSLAAHLDSVGTQLVTFAELDLTPRHMRRFCNCGRHGSIRGTKDRDQLAKKWGTLRGVSTLVNGKAVVSA